MRLMQYMVFFWLSLFIFAFSVAPACEGDKKNDEKVTSDCGYRGVCIISYKQNQKGRVIAHRRCTLGAGKERSCGECWDLKFEGQDKLRQKTCLVCKLCKEDFECLQGDDCPKTAPFCQGGTCVMCRSASDCPEEKHFCQEGQCVSCRSDSDCLKSEKPQCEGGICVACQCGLADKKKPYCYKSSKDRSVECVECTSDEHCEVPTPRCDLKRHRCSPACEKDVDCKPHHFCQDGACLECRQHSDCKDPKRPVCVKGQCRCSEDSDCPKDFAHCVKGTCIRCRTGEDCPEGFPRCLEGECLLRLCQKDSQCTDDNYRHCRRFGTSSVCVGCLKDSDCPSGKKCDLSLFRCR